MTHHSEQASANAGTAHPTTKSLCPAGAGIINQPAAPEGSHTPPQACATPAINLACQPPSKAPHAQLVEGYKHPPAAFRTFVLRIDDIDQAWPFLNRLTGAFAERLALPGITVTAMSMEDEISRVEQLEADHD
ncbi:hypothetical protein GCM10007418_03670 [Halopseudomonas salina]|uniref:Uncharacterized protein n=1 Tax=Halopseudomonas salina TaxID=1323744 RepID=A0ABQ1NY46_9GAMM|nr:hypothetical protein GCM10007418_03670 [Halopseudomonas salina]